MLIMISNITRKYHAHARHPQVPVQEQTLSQLKLFLTLNNKSNSVDTQSRPMIFCDANPLVNYYES